MRGHRILRSALLAGAAWAGVVAGHSITYLLTIPQAGVRDALLASTGHAYWFAAVAAALLLSAVSAAAAFARGLRRGMAGPARRTVGAGVWPVAVRLALLQTGIYLVQEIVERLEVGVPLSELARHHILAVGIPVQILVALALALVLAALHRAGEAAGQVLHRAPVARPPGRIWAPVELSRADGGLLLLHGIRAPPCTSCFSRT